MLFPKRVTSRKIIQFIQDNINYVERIVPLIKYYKNDVSNGLSKVWIRFLITPKDRWFHWSNLFLIIDFQYKTITWSSDMMLPESREFIRVESGIASISGNIDELRQYIVNLVKAIIK